MSSNINYDILLYLLIFGYITVFKDYYYLLFLKMLHATVTLEIKFSY